jgi:nitrite reductase/ring-hydroxylating ferredoxin subunit
VVQAGRAEVGIFNVAGRFYALSNICVHQFGPVCEGRVGGTTACDASTGWQLAWTRDGEILTCPWHGHEFDIISGHCLANPRLSLRRYQVDVDGEHLMLIV